MTWQFWAGLGVGGFASPIALHYLKRWLFGQDGGYQ